MNNNLSDYIKELLTEHECVVIPGLGGFISRIRPAKITNGGTLIHPPGKDLLFNKNLVNNDGLLTHYVAHKRKLSFSEALIITQSFANEIHYSLNNKLRVELAGIGVLYKDKDHNILFESINDENFLLDSYGLFPLSVKTLAIKQDLTNEKTPFPAIDRTVLHESIQRQPKRKAPSILKYAAVAIIAAGTVFITLRQKAIRNFVEAGFTFNSPSTQHLVQLNKEPFVYPKYVSPKKGNDSIADYHGIIEIKNVDEKGKSFYFSEKSEQNSSPTSQLKKKKNVYFLPKPNEGPYHLIVGCFANPNNAEKLVLSLMKEGKTASIIGKNNKGLYMVSASSFNENGLAKVGLEELRNDFPSAWIFVQN